MALPRWRASSRKIDREIRRLRRWGIAYAIAILTVFVGGLVFTAVYYIDEVERQDRVNDLVATEPHRQTTVFEIFDPGEDEDPIARIQIDGGIVEIQTLESLSLWDLFFGDSYSVGDEVTVVVDPIESHHAWDIEDQKDLTPWSRIGTLLVGWGFIGLMGKFFLWRFDWRLPVPLRGLRHFIRPEVAVARVTELRKVSWHESFLVSDPVATLVVEINDRLHVWDVHSYKEVDLEVGMTFDVWGTPRLGGWVVGMTSPHKLYPRSPLD